MCRSIIESAHGRQHRGVTARAGTGVANFFNYGSAGVTVPLIKVMTHICV